jgi:hypothetical protein
MVKLMRVEVVLADEHVMYSTPFLELSGPERDNLAQHNLS